MGLLGDDPPATAPPRDTVEAWCLDWLETTDLARKLRPGPVPADDVLDWETGAPARRVARPGRSSALSIVGRSPRTPRGQALRDGGVRARLVHTFLHHELQAAELFAWAVLAFPGTPRAFRRGLLRLAQEELDHLELYHAHLERLGHAYGDFPVRDWFWERVPRCRDATEFVALVGLGLEGANLEHSARFAEEFRAAGDEEGARILERVEREEVAHVAFAVKWFRRFAGELDYERWAEALPAPITPSLLRGRPLNHTARQAAGMDADFLARLAKAPATSRSQGKR